jgi:serine/threonine-protein kinase
MDLVDGPSLDDVIRTLPGNPDEIRRIMLGILAAVDHAHRCGVIHRDLKPGNVLLDGPARIPRVTDFGIAKVVDRSTTADGARMGTLPYSSPEQLRGGRHATVRSDIFSLGVVLYEMTTGALPFRGECELDVMNAIVAGTYFLPRVIDPVLARVIRRALDPDPLRRFGTCGAMAAALGGA